MPVNLFCKSGMIAVGELVSLGDVHVLYTIAVENEAYINNSDQKEIG